MLRSVTRKMQIKTTVFHYKCTRLTKILKDGQQQIEEDLEQLECSHIVGINVKSYSHLENNWQFLTIRTHRILLTANQRIDNVSPHTNLSSNVHGSFTHDSSKLETAQMPIS